MNETWEPIGATYDLGAWDIILARRDGNTIEFKHRRCGMACMDGSKIDVETGEWQKYE